MRFIKDYNYETQTNDCVKNYINELEAENKKLREGNSNLHIKYMNLIEENLKLRECVEFVKLDMKHTLYYSGIHKGKQTWFLARNINEKARKTLAEIDKK